MSRKVDPKRGDPCPKCGKTLVVKLNMFALRGLGFFSGLVCEPCNALWNDPEDDFLGAAAKIHRLREEIGKNVEPVFTAAQDEKPANDGWGRLVPYTGPGRQDNAHEATP